MALLAAEPPWDSGLMAGRTAWFPGHMAKGTRQLEELLDKLDLILEVRDARAPELTASPWTAQLRSSKKPLWVVLTKRDLADDGATAEWLSHYQSRRSQAWAFDVLKGHIGPLERAFGKIKPAYRELRLAVVGIPNVGKSALLNLLVGKRRAPVGAVPGVTRGVSWYRGKDYLVVDSPGILDPHSGEAVQKALAWLGCSRPDVIGGYDVVAWKLVDFLIRQDLWYIVEKKWSVAAHENPSMTLEALGKRLGCLVSGGAVDQALAGRRLLESFSSGKLGKVSLERPGSLAMKALDQEGSEGLEELDP